MAKSKKSRKPPSRQRYDEDHHVRSVRLDKEHDELLDKLLEGAGWSFSDFVKAHIRKDTVMVERKVEILASRQADPSLEGRVRCLEALLNEVFMLTVDTDEYPPLCPRCENQELHKCEGREMDPTLKAPWVMTWKCPRCGFFLDTYKRIDPKSINWIEPDTGK